MEFHQGKSPWYEEDGATAGTLKRIVIFERLRELGSAYGYFPEESKSVLILKDKDREKAENFKKENNHDFVIKNGYRYLGSFIGGKEVKIE